MIPKELRKDKEWDKIMEEQYCKKCDKPIQLCKCKKE